MKKPLVSVIMSAYNADGFISKSIESILAQTYDNIETIICDDGSTDSTAEVIKRYPSVKYLFQSNQGQGAGRNNAAALANGDYLAFIDADDIWLPEKIALQIDLLLNKPNVGAVYADMEIVDINGEFLGFNAKGKMERGNIFNSLIGGNYMCGLSSLVVRTSIFKEQGGFSDHRYCQDFVLLLKIAYRYQIDFVDQSLVKYLSHDNNISKRIDIAYPEQISFYESLHEQYHLDEAQRKLAIEQLKNLYFSYAVLHFRKKNFKKTAEVLSWAESKGLMLLKSRVLLLFNIPGIRNLIYNKI